MAISGGKPDGKYFAAKTAQMSDACLAIWNLSAFIHKNCPPLSKSMPGSVTKRRENPCVVLRFWQEIAEQNTRLLISCLL